MLALSGEVKFTKVKDHSTAATDAVESDAIDMAESPGYDSVCFLTSFGTAAANNTIKAQQSDDNGAADDWTDLEGSSVASGSSDEDAWLDVLRPTKRYVRAVAARGTSSTLESIWALRYSPRGRGLVDNTISGTITGEAHVSPAEGTA